MKQLYLLIVLIIAVIKAPAQTGSAISGKVKDEEGKPLASVTVSLLRASDSMLVKAAIADQAGGYEFTGVKAGPYVIAASGVGFQQAKSAPVLCDGSQHVVVPAITLRALTKNLTGVVVQAKRPLVENKIDKLVVNVDAAPTNAGSSAMDVLEKSPGVAVDKDGNISLKGKQGIIVLVDGKQTYLSGPDLANLLRNMPASQLDQIEIMTQPSAKYDASGNSGIINLRTKKSLLRGLNGSVNLSYVQGRYPKSPNSFNFNYRTAKFNFFSNLSYSYWSNFNDQTIVRTFHDGSTGQVSSVFDQQANQKNSSRNYNARLGLDYNLDSKTTLGIAVNGIYNPSRWVNNGRANIYNAAGTMDSFNTVYSENRNEWRDYGGNLNFRRVLKGNGHELTADVDYIQYNSSSQQVSNNYNYYPNGSLTGYPFLLNGNLPSIITIYSGKADYVQPLQHNDKIEAGVKSSYVTTDNNAQYTRFDQPDQKWIVDNSRTNHFVYKENINAAYASYSRQIKKWGLQLGLRVENTVAKGNQFGNAVQKDSSFTRNYVQLFPTAFFSYAANDNNQFVLSYGRRIERPNYEDMNPFQYFLDQYTYRQGNPDLRPQFTHNIELSHNYRSALNTTVNYTYTTDILNDILKQNDATKVTYQTKENVASLRNIGLAISYNKALTKWWTSSLYANVNNNHYKGFVNNQQLDVSMTTFMANGSQQFQFLKTWNAEITGWYRSRAQETGMFILRRMGMFSVGLTKQIMNRKASLKLNINDPFYLQKAKVDINFGNINAYVFNQWDNRRIGLTFTYRFSKGQNFQAPQRRTGSSDEEQRRVGQGSN